MRILHISTRLILGGSQENTVLSCEGQARAGHDVHLAFGPIYGPEGSLLERVEKFRAGPGGDGPGGDGRGITTHVVQDLVRELSPARDLDCYFALKRLIRAIKPDIVHTHSSKAGVIGRGAAWAVGGRFGGGRIGVVHTVHGPPFHPYEKPWRNRLYIASERWAARRCHKIVCVADAMTRLFLSHRIGRPDQYVTVYSGMETAPFLEPAPGESREEVRAALGIEAGDLVIGTVARLAELKGHDDLLDALGSDLLKHPGLKLLWVGDGWWRDRLEQRIGAMGLSRQVLMTGLLPPERIPGLMRAMDVLAHPSYREGLPRTVPQALLAGTGVVAYDTDGTSEVVRDKETGRLVRAGDITALREAVLWMLEDEPRRRVTAQRGRELCRERFDAGAMVRELERVYEAARG